MLETCLSGSMSGVWKRSMIGFQGTHPFIFVIQLVRQLVCSQWEQVHNQAAGLAA